MDNRPAPSGEPKSRIPGWLQSVSSSLRHALDMPRSHPLRPPRSSGTRTKPGPSSKPPSPRRPDALSPCASTRSPGDVPHNEPTPSTSFRSSIPVRSKKDKPMPVMNESPQQPLPQNTRSSHPLNNLMPEASRSCDSCHDALTGIDSSEYYRIPPKPNHPRPTIPPIPHEFPPDHPLLTRAVIAQPNCHLLDLPLELRQKIHDRILAQDITVDLRLPKTKHTSPCSSWIQTCSQLYQECAEAYYRNLRFVIWAPVFPFPPNNDFVLAKRLRAIGAEFLEQQRRRPHMTPRRVWIVWGLIGDIRDNEHEDRNNRWIEARDLIWDYFYWAHHYIPNVRLMVVYEWFMADGRRAIFCDDTRERQLWQCAKYRDGGDVSETTSAERESMELWNRQLGQWSHGQSQSTRVQRLWERGMPLFPLEHPAGQGGDE